jgi:oxygen-independent coproporphyrinogen-3 oxidase
VNPGTVSAADLKRYRAAGIDRLSIGIQSFNDHNLRFLGRIHTSAEARQVFNYSREAGFDNSSIDMIYGLPHQDQKSWLQDLKAAVELKPEHISCYMLTYAPGTLLYRQRKDRNIKPLPDRRLRRLYEITTQFLSAKGYDQYEISNFARQTSGSSDRFVSKHNFKYWTFAPYIGLGPSAHSFLSPVRFWNVADLRQYAQKLNKDCLPIQEMERLTPEQQAMEAIYLGLRLTEGLSIDFFNERFGVDFLSAHGELIKRLKQNGYLNIEDSRCKLTLMGMVLHDSISAMFISHEPSVHKQNC